MIPNSIDNPALERGVGKILFIDDEPGLVDVGVQMLQSSGYEAIGFNDPEIALVEFSRIPDSFDAVITDQVMPGMTGDELAAKIIKTRPQMPIFLCTGYSEKMNKESALKAGFSDFFLKPVSIADLSIALKGVLKTGDKQEIDSNNGDFLANITDNSN